MAKRASHEYQPIYATQPLQTQITNLDRLIKHPPLNSRLVEFGPELAGYVLETYNAHNRPMKPGNIKLYAEDLKAGNWGLTGDTIKFGSDHRLKDGQNRLSAVVQSGVPMTTHVVFGIDPELFARMDIGKVRTGGDVFAIEGLPYANVSAAAVRWLKILTSGKPGDRGARFSNEELLETYRKHVDPERLKHSVKMALEVRKTTGQPVAALAALHYLFYGEEPAKADAFFTEWATGRYSGSKSRSPVALMQARLTELANVGSGRVHENMRNLVIITAWRAYSTGDRRFGRNSLMFQPGEPVPEPV